jgi:broad specificity phosphatase PhoE
MTRLIFVRHAETDMAGKLCGHSNPGLNPCGRDQLVSLTEQLERKELRKIFSSDLARARQTADAIAAHFGLEVHERPGMREIYFGEWEGLSWTEIESRDPEKAKRWLREYPYMPAPRGETWMNFQFRVFEEVEFLRHEAMQQPTIAVTHAGFLRVALPIFFQTSEAEILEGTKRYGAVFTIDPELGAF